MGRDRREGGAGGGGRGERRMEIGEGGYRTGMRRTGGREGCLHHLLPAGLLIF